MLPNDLNRDICSLNQDEQRLSVTLWIDINPQTGLVDFESSRYELSKIQNRKRFTYAEADKLLKEESKEDNALSSALKALQRSAQSRRAFRKDIDCFTMGPHH